MGFWGCSHSWTKWSKPFKRGRNKGMQQCHCRKCGELKTRKAKAPWLHVHRWQRKPKNAPYFTCKVIGCDKKRAFSGRK